MDFYRRSYPVFGLYLSVSVCPTPVAWLMIPTRRMFEVADTAQLKIVVENRELPLEPILV